ncbi:hypothetical protein V5O48_007458 [Marasmius crinis-equi]|uniref:mitogen-activated protein kinase kinase kinase n=1 Tax=Marasmius crinis-equi TaxID=585013 RepID=A0ABR3FGN8_9AGAR
MLRLSKNSGLHPQCLSIQNVKKLGEYPIAAGGFGDVWKGVIGDSTKPVCLKVVKIYLDSDLEKLSNEYLREGILWRQMKHPNLLPFLGIYRLEDTQQLCLISPWMDKGNLVQFLRTTPREGVDHHTLAHDIASGLSYLHMKKIVHGDLKGLNVLVTDSLRACIGDFGLARIADAYAIGITSSSTRPFGTARWLAPELLVGGGGPSKASDVYSYACVCYEIFTGGHHPFPELPNEMIVAFHVAQGKRPSRPGEASELSDTMWSIMQTCWDPTPSSRPTADTLLNQIAAMSTRTGTSPAVDWNESVFTQVWGNIEYPSLAADSHNNRQDQDGYPLNTEISPQPSSKGSSLDDPSPAYNNASPGAVSSKYLIRIQPDFRKKSIWDLADMDASPEKTVTSTTPSRAFRHRHLASAASPSIPHPAAEEMRALLAAQKSAAATLGKSVGEHSGQFQEKPKGASSPPELNVIVCRAKALQPYTAGADHPDRLSFAKDEVLDILNRQGRWWKAKKSDGKVGVVRCDYLKTVAKAPRPFLTLIVILCLFSFYWVFAHVLYESSILSEVLTKLYLLVDRFKYPGLARDGEFLLPLHHHKSSALEEVLGKVSDLFIRNASQVCDHIVTRDHVHVPLESGHSQSLIMTRYGNQYTP